MIGLAVGQELPTLEVEITLEQIREYAEASGDRNPIHLDEAFARGVGLPGVIAHGMLAMGLLGRLVTDWAGGADRVRLLRCRFAAMVLPGDRLRFGGRVVRREGDAAELELWAENQRGERVLTKAAARVVA